MYILANGVKINEKMHQQLCQAVKDTSKKYVYFFDMGTGKLVRVSRVRRRKLAEIKKESQRFISLPKVTKEERRERFRAFVEEVGVIDVPELETRLRKELLKGASIDRLEKILENDPSGWIHGWVQDEHDLLAERIEEWIKSPPLNARDDLDYWYDDDCPVCQLMRKMEEEGRNPTLEETHQAFLKAKEKGAFVGGEMFEKHKNYKEKDLVDQEIDKMLEMAKSGNFEPGIYNFCDRWCEKCEDTEKCLLFAQEKWRKEQGWFKNESNIGDETFWDEIKHSFEVTQRLIERGLAEEGFDPKKILEEGKQLKHWDDEADKRYEQVECLILAKKYMKEVHQFLEDFHQNRFQFYPELGMEVDFSDIKDEVETISWYHTLLPIKTWRFLYEKESFERERDGQLKELMDNDLGKYYALVKKCINKSKMAWQSLAKKRNELDSTSSQFVIILNKIENEFNKIGN